MFLDRKIDFYEFSVPIFNVENIRVDCFCYNYTCILFPLVEGRSNLKLLKVNTLKGQTFANKSFSISRFLENFEKIVREIRLLFIINKLWKFITTRKRNYHYNEYFLTMWLTSLHKLLLSIRNKVQNLFRLNFNLRVSSKSQVPKS